MTVPVEFSIMEVIILTQFLLEDLLNGSDDQGGIILTHLCYGRVHHDQLD